MPNHSTDSPFMLRYGVCALVCLPVLVFGGSPSTDLVPFTLMAGILLVRPRGIFGAEGVLE